MTCFLPYCILPVAILISACSSTPPTASDATLTSAINTHSEMGPPVLKAPLASASQRFFVVGRDAETKATLTRTIESASEEFAALFGRIPPPTAIVSGGIITPAQRMTLAADGYTVLLPWIDGQAKAEMRRASVRQQVTAQMADASEAVREAAITQTLRQLGSAVNTLSREQELGALAHELSHMWFIDLFTQPGETPEGGHAYGGWAPDWLDEMAAVLLENDYLMDRRRVRFKAMGEARRIPLSEFLTMEHPGAKAAAALGRQQAAAGGGGTRIITLSGEEARQFIAASGGERAPDFYSQVLVFSDYLEARTGRNDMVAVIATALSKGQMFEDWLADNPTDLPRSISELEADWSDFLDN